MSKDYKKIEKKPVARGSGGSLLVGILIGLVLGLSIALCVAWYINKMPSPFPRKATPAVKDAKDVAKNDAKAGVKPPADKAAKGATQGEPRFTFHDILTKGEEAGTDQQFKDAQKASTAGEKDAFFLQAGAFQNAPDADNLKARLALIGIEATIQTATLPDKGVLHRVRIGPYASIEELNRTRDALKQNGYETSLIKVQDGQRR